MAKIENHFNIFMKVKQVIVIRKDLNMRKGKQISQDYAKSRIKKHGN